METQDIIKDIVISLLVYTVMEKSKGYDMDNLQNMANEINQLETDVSNQMLQHQDLVSEMESLILENNIDNLVRMDNRINILETESNNLKITTNQNTDQLNNILSQIEGINKTVNENTNLINRLIELLDKNGLIDPEELHG